MNDWRAPPVSDQGPALPPWTEDHRKPVRPVTDEHRPGWDDPPEERPPLARRPK